MMSNVTKEEVMKVMNKLGYELDFETLKTIVFINKNQPFLNGHPNQVMFKVIQPTTPQEVEEAHEAREILFKFATSNEKYDLLEGRKLNKVLGNFIDGNSYLPQLSDDVQTLLDVVYTRLSRNEESETELSEIHTHILALETKLKEIEEIVKRTFPNDVVEGMKQIKSILECDKE